ncbi:MAG TPA: protein translocase subunit SecD [Acidimicrobiales bacterium]|jgi:preprotein translocase subunit SecD
MKNKRALWASLISLVLIAAIALGATLAAGWSPKLGLDLEGGLSVVYKTDKPVNSAQLNTVVSILNSRVTAGGTSGANVGTQGTNEVVVSIPGEKNTQKVLQTLGNTAQLFFRPGLCYAPPYTPTKGSTPPTGPLPTCAASSQLTATNLAVKPDSSNVNGYTSNTNIPVDPQFAANPSTSAATDDKNATVLLPGSSAAQGSGRYVLGPAALTGSAVHSASAQLVNNQWAVSIVLTSAGSTAWDTLSQQQFHAIIGIDLDGQVISAPITQPSQAAFSSFNGQVQISGSFTQSQAQTLATELNYGSLPVKLDRINVQTVSPTLGKASLQAGLISGLAGLGLVMLYMILYYRLLGAVVVSGLLVTAGLLWAIIAFMGQQLSTTIDLAGIIGVIVSVGITVDSYIVYFERLKDETRSGRTVRTSVDKGFKSAFRTVLAADAVSLMGAIVLYEVSIGQVQGFALFLGISTLLDIVVTYFFTKPFVILLGRSRGMAESGRVGMAAGLGVLAEDRV